MHVIADIRIIRIQRAIGAVAEPVWIVIIARVILPENDFPKSGMKVGINGVENRLRGSVGGWQTLVMGVLIFVKDDLCDRSEKI